MSKPAESTSGTGIAADRELLRRLLVEEAGSIPASSGQRRLWLVDRLGEKSGAYNVFQAVRLLGDLDVSALGGALTEVLRRHDVLRTTFSAVDGEPVPAISCDDLEVFIQTNLSGDPTEEKEATLNAIVHQELTHHFDLSRGPLLRIRLLALNASEHLLLFNLHHIIVDGWSLEVLFDDLSTTYAALHSGAGNQLARPEIQYADFTRWERDWLRSPKIADEIDYWRNQLDGLAVLQMPTDRPRPPKQTLAGAQLVRDLPAELAQGIRTLGQRKGTTLFMTLLAGFVTLLRCYSGQDEIVLGSPIANRGRREFERVIGFFVNNLVLRTQAMESDSFSELLARVRELCLNAFAHQQVPFERLVEELQPERDLSRNPLFQVAFALQREALEALQLDGLHASRYPVDAVTTHVDLECHVIESRRGLTIRLVYSTGLFSTSTIERMLGHYERILHAAVSDPEARIGDIELLSDADRHRLLVDWNAPRDHRNDEQTLVDRFRDWAVRQPDLIAADFGQASLSYAQLDAATNRFACSLREEGVKRGDRVGLCVERGPGLVIGILSIWKAGAAYLPLDPKYPESRLQFMLEDAEVKCVLTDAVTRPQIERVCGTVRLVDIALHKSAEYAQSELPELPGSTDLAYMIYTSGSTGQPKAALLEHRGLVNVSEEQVRLFGAGPGHRVLQFSSPSFDAATFDLVMALGSGATLVLAEAESIRPGPPLAETLREKAISILTIPPSALGALSHTDLPSLKVINVAGEACPPQLVSRWCGDGRRFFNLYGPTECTIWSTYAECQADDQAPPIGRPIANVPCYVLDQRGRLAAAGIPGELYIGGVGVARGYWRREELNRERFVADPFSEEQDALMYRTGDLVRWSGDGLLHFIGRIDEQVKLRGFRVELGEVEQVLLAFKGVREALVMCREDVPGDERLVAYVVAEHEGDVAPDVLRARLKQQLPEYMVPSAIVLMDVLPLTPNGKVDRAALPSPEGERQTEQVYVAPRSELEQNIAAIWCEILAVDQVGIDDNFFELGGHSLLATKVVSRVRVELSIDLPLTRLFDAPTVRQLAEQCSATGTGEIEGSVIVPVARDRCLPVSRAQRRLWFLSQLEPDNPSYNIPIAVRLIGNLSVESLERSIRMLIERHELFRVRFEQQDGQPFQVIDAQSNFKLAVQDLRELPAAERESMLRSCITAEAGRLFDLEAGPLLRGLLLQAGESDRVLLLTMHHIICDGWSSGLIFKEIGATYDALESDLSPALPPLQVQYVDFAAWQQQPLFDDSLQVQLQYWCKQLDGLAPLALHTDRPRPAVRTYRGKERQLNLSPELMERLHQLGRDQEVSLFMILLAALAMLLHRHGAGNDIAIGCPIAGRHQHQTEDMLGFFINTLIMRIGIAPGLRFDELLAEARRTALDAYEHQDVPFEKLVETLDPERDLSRNSLFEVFLNVVNLETIDLQMRGLSVTKLQTGLETAKFDLTLYAVETPGELLLRFNYNSDLFDEASVDRLLRHFNVLLEAVTRDPLADISTLPLFDPAELALHAHDDRASSAISAPRTLTEGFRQQVLARPDALAVVDSEASWSYRDIDQLSDLIAGHLSGRLEGKEGRVALLLGQRAPTIAAQLAVLKAGMAFVALDPFDPPQRLAALVADADVSAILTDAQRLASAEANLPASIPLVCIDKLAPLAAAGSLPSRQADDIAYLLYTSGSTGLPKGVLQSDRNVIHHCTTYAMAAGIVPGERISLLSSYSFDAAVVDTFGGLLSGATLCVYDLREQSIEHLPAWLEEQAVVVYHSTATVFRHMLRSMSEQQSLPRVRLVVLGGEPIHGGDHRMFRAHFAPGCRLLNLYGSTESSFSMQQFFDHDDRPTAPTLPIGKAVEATEVRLVNTIGELVDVFGEIEVSSRHVAFGYWNAPELTAARFHAAANGVRTYRTGDMGYRRVDGLIEFIGRGDQQVKLRGFRIELGELESVLEHHPSVTRALAVARTDADGETRLVAYVVASAGLALDVQALQAQLRGRLPGYMVPGAIVEIDRIPLTAGGKVKTAELPLPDFGADCRAQYAEPRNHEERAIAAIWRDVLGVEQVGVRDDFFNLGGHSLKATRIRSRITDALGVQLPLRTLFEHRTVAELAEQVASAGVSTGQRISAAAAEPHGDATDGLTDEQVEAMLNELAGSRGLDS